LSPILKLKYVTIKKKLKQKPGGSEENTKFPLPIYKKEDDIYYREKEEPLEDEDHPLQTNTVNRDGMLGEDLDVPSAELGDEDEENNYYSLGGDNHDDLEEDNG
jgi:hypothetical protein